MHHDQAAHAHPMPLSHLTLGGQPLYIYFSAHCVMRARSTLYRPVPHDHGVSCCRSDAERQCRPEVVARTEFREPVRGSARYLTGGRFRLLPDGFRCQNHRENDTAHYLRLSPAAHFSARILLPSSSAADQSTRPFVSSSESNPLKIMLITPDFDHRLK